MKKQKMSLESLESLKFKKLEHSASLHVLGGSNWCAEGTGGGRNAYFSYGSDTRYNDGNGNLVSITYHQSIYTM